MKNVVALSGGKDSTAMALRLRELQPDTEFTYICTPTGRELPEMFDHWNKLSELLGKKLIPVVHPLGLTGMIKKYNALPNFRMRWCTRELKIEVSQEWMARNSPMVFYVGIRADEEMREGGDYSKVPDVEQRFPMREWGWGLRRVLEYLEEKGVKVPERTDCDCCFWQRLGEWKALWRDHPDRYRKAIEEERATGHTFRSPGRDTWPTKLEDLQKEFERGRPIRGEKKQLGLFEEMKCRVCRI